jgi:hypothetical protein
VGRASERYMEYSISTNSNKSVYGHVYQAFGSVADGGFSQAIGGNITWQPASNVSISMGPRFDKSHGEGQYIRTIEDATNTLFYGNRYVFSDISSQTVSMDTRLNVTFTPTMSLQLFAQPYISSNEFSSFKEYARPRAADKLVYGQDIGTVTGSGSDVTIDPDGAGSAGAFTVRDPDFTFRSLRGNAVFRWEYTPGSTLFLVWTQDRSSEELNGRFDFDRDRQALFDSPSNHVFLVKVNYWLPL